MIHLRVSRTLTVASIVIAIAASTVLSQTPGPPSNPALAPAVQLIRDGETHKALDVLKKAVRENKTDGEAWYYLGIVYLQLSDFKKAAAAFKKATEVRPDLAAQAQAGYAYALALRNNLDAASAAANQALEIDPTNIDALYTLALVDLRKGAKQEAIVKADTIIALKPDFAAAYLLKSQAFVSLGAATYPISAPPPDRQLRYRSAADALEKYLALETNPRAAEGWKEQLETLKFHLGEGAGDVHTGRDVTTKVRVIAKPEPSYTERARQEQIVGRVVLRCVFAADGTVKHILVVQGLPNGLTERSVAAAKQIKFIPATVNGTPVSMWMQLEYNFNLY
jgi:TonB family protein